MTSSMLLRVMRVITAIGIVPKARAGRMRCSRPSQNPAKLPVRSESTSTSPVKAVMEVPLLNRPGNGRSPRFTVKITTRIIASQKIGMLIPVSARTEVILSSQEYCLTAEITPTGIPTSTAMNMAKAVSSAVTGRPVTMESPRSPVNASLRNTTYWTSTGLSSPIWARSCSTCSWVAFCPRRICAGSPGMARTMKNTMMDTPKSTGMICKILRPINWVRALTPPRKDRRHAPGQAPCLRASAAQADGVERLAAGRVRLIALHLVLQAHRGLDVGDGNPRGVLDEHLLRLEVEPLALVLVYGRPGLIEYLIYLRVLVVGNVQRVFLGCRLAREEDVQEVVRVAVVPGPTEQAHVVLASTRLLQVRPPLVGDELGVYAHLLEVLLHRLCYALAVRYVRTWDGHVPEGGLQVLGARLLEHLLCLLGIEGIML